MKKKINRRFVEITVFSILITTAVMSVIFYTRLKTQVFSDLKVIASLLTEDMTFNRLPEDTRVTVIDEEGTVQYDSVMDIHKLENHKNRPEVAAALLYGDGQGIRKSDTLSKSVFYYAVKMENGEVLRVGKESASVTWVILSAIPIVLIVVLILSAICMVASHYLTAAIVEPIETMVKDMEHIDETATYEELIPFARMIRSQHEEILSAANMRQEFTANVSHELKTPLTAISGYAELMETGVAKEADVRHFSREIHKSASRLLNLINDIIKLSKLDAGEQEDLMEIVDLAMVASDTVEMLRINADKMGVNLQYIGCDSAKIRMGKELAEEVTYNLIENAIRYNNRGGSVVVDVTSNAGGIILKVEDTGIGIPGEHQKRIFERFYRVDKSRSKALGGTGLGLAIVKHICELTQGTLVLESEVNRGTVISIQWFHENHE